MRFLVAVLLTVVCASSANAQHHGQQGQTAQPYATLQTRAVKALSEQQIDDLRNGRGAGLALAGELNGYPGPLHVLELADQLELDGIQRAGVEKLFAEMKAEAVSVGERLIAEETALDRAFAEKDMSVDLLADMTNRIGSTQGKLRAVHLKYHLTTSALLSSHQKHLYAQLRGYR